MSVKSCHLCGRDFGLFRWRHQCSECQATICSSCSPANYLNRTVCRECQSTIAASISNVVVVRSGHVGGHVTVREIGPIVTPEWTRVHNEAVERLKHICVQAGGNAIVSLDILKETQSEPGSGDGTHYYSVFKATGTAVVIKKRGQRDWRQSPGSVAKDLESLSRLKSQGALTLEEFQAAKRQLLAGTEVPDRLGSAPQELDDISQPSHHPAGWHPDPHGRHEYRYWDSIQWTSRVSDNGVVGEDRV